MLNKITFLLFIFLFSLSLVETSCNKGDHKKLEQNRPKSISYRYIKALKTSQIDVEKYPARLEAIRNIEIRPKIDGFIENVYIDEGAIVKKGQNLFRILNPQYEQDVILAEASVKSAQAAVSTAEMQVKKLIPLVEKEIISAYELKSAELSLQSKKALLAETEAKLANAKITLDYTLIKSPVNGFSGNLPYRLGSYVNSTTKDALTTISDISTIYAYFSVNEKNHLNIVKKAHLLRRKKNTEPFPEVSLVLSDGSLYKEKGKIESVSGLVDPHTGSFTLRASFKNTDKILRSGYSAIIQMPVNLENIILIPQKTTFEIQGKTFVYVVDEANKVKSSEVKVTSLQDGQMYAVTSGLEPGDRVIVEGIVRLKEGMEILPEETSLKEIFSEANP